jgi:hypothetical protein
MRSLAACFAAATRAGTLGWILASMAPVLSGPGLACAQLAQPLPPVEHTGDLLAAGWLVGEPSSLVEASQGIEPLPGELPSAVPHSQNQRPWGFQLLPEGLLYRSYLAGTKEPRIASVWSDDRDYGKVWDVALGGRTGFWRYGTCGGVDPEGWQLDLEGAALCRLDPILDSTPLIAVDYRIGIPLTYAQGPWQAKFGYYHLSSHLGDEFMLLTPDFNRINFTRDAIILGVGYFWTDAIRTYGEASYSPAASGGAKPWEFQFGAEFSPTTTAIRGAPFAAINGHLREEVRFGGNVVAQVGWQWRGITGKRFRLGAQYYNGKNDQYSFFDEYESKIGFGLWYDF